jgi:hypothetical protein
MLVEASCWGASRAHHKYLSICLINGNGIPSIDPFKDDGSKLLDVFLLRSTDNEDDSTWDPEDDECNNIDNNSFEDDNVSNGESQDENECESFHGADRTDHLRKKTQFDTRDVAVLKSTNGFLCPSDLVAYQQSVPRGKSKSSTIVSLLDPNFPKKNLENGYILRPFINEVKREKMYNGGACGHLTEPLLVWMKLEHCTLFVACTVTFFEIDNDDTNTNDKDGTTYDKHNFREGKLQYTKYLDSE